jgi:hypothetical protein
MKKKLLCLFAFSFAIALCYAQSLHRDSIVNELQNLKAAIIKGNKEKVEALFTFPVNNEELKLKVAFSGDKEIKLSTLDKKAFEKYYSRIITRELIGCFSKLDMNRLKSTNKIINVFIPKSAKDKLAYTYEISIEQKNTIIIQWNANPRDDIKMKEEEIPGEYSEIWHLKFLNGKLHFENFFAAG